MGMETIAISWCIRNRRSLAEESGRHLRNALPNSTVMGRGALQHAGRTRVEMAVVDMVIGRKPSTPSIAGRYAHGRLNVAKSPTP